MFATSVTIGDDSGIGRDCELYGEVHIGDHTMMAVECVFYTCNHKTSCTDVPMNQQGETEPRSKQKEPWLVLFMLATILVLNRCMKVFFGTTMGHVYIIVARAVVTKNVPSYSIVGCQPRSLDRGVNDV